MSYPSRARAPSLRRVFVSESPRRTRWVRVHSAYARTQTAYCIRPAEFQGGGARFGRWQICAGRGLMNFDLKLPVLAVCDLGPGFICGRCIGLDVVHWDGRYNLNAESVSGVRLQNLNAAARK